MIGRVQELAELMRLLDDAHSGRGRAALVLGEPGMGKSTLIDALIAGAEAAGIRVATGWCTSAEAPPYWPWIPIMRALDPAHQAATSGTGGDAALARRRLVASTWEALSTAAVDAGLLVIIEDAHWADLASLDVLRFVVDALRGTRVLVVATARDDQLEADPDVATRLRDLPTSVMRLQLGGLDHHEVAELVAQVAGAVPDPVVTEVHERTGGNPFFVREVARLLAARLPYGPATVPAGVREVLERRLARLSQDCHTVLGAAAVAGDTVDVPLVAAVAGLPEAKLLRLLDEAIRARLMTGDTSPRFSHALVREVLEAGLPMADRAALHARVAEELEPRATDDPDLAGVLADHWSRSVRSDAKDRAATWSLHAARTAMRRLGFEQAVIAYRRFLTGPNADRLQVLLELGEAERLAGDFDGSRRTLREAAALARTQGRPEELARAALGLGGGVAGFEVRLHDETQVALLRDAARILPAEDSALRAAILARLSVALTNMGTAAERVTLAEDAVAMAARIGDASAEVAALAAYCDALAGPDHVAARLDAASHMIELAVSATDPVATLLGRRLRLVALLEHGELAAVDAEIIAYASLADELGIPLYAWYVPLWRGMRALMSGDPEAALRCADETEEIGRRAGSDNAAMLVFALRNAAHHSQGATLPGYRTTIEEFLDKVAQPTTNAMTAALLAHAGELDQAAAALQLVRREGLALLPRDSEWLGAMWFLAEAAIVLEEREVAAEVARVLRPYPNVWIVDGIGAATYGACALQLGRLAAMLGERDEARQWLSTALEHHRAAGAVSLTTATEQALQALDDPRARIRRSPAATPASAERAGFVREGRLWHLDFRGDRVTIADSKGMRDLAVLLAAPRRDVHVLDLVAPAISVREGSAGELLDAQARSAYQRRLGELVAELEEAADAADAGRAERLRTEHDFIIAELAAAFGLAGRPRTAADPVERARKAVAMRISTALRAISEVHPTLADHLRISVSTGRFCAYRPDRKIVWRTS